jgi:hypothetical protein
MRSRNIKAGFFAIIDNDPKMFEILRPSKDKPVNEVISYALL